MSLNSQLALILSQRKFIKIDKAVLEIWPNKNACTVLFYPGTMLAPGHYQLFLFCLYMAGFTVTAIHFEGHGKAASSNSFTFSSLLSQGLQAEEWLNKYYDNVVVCGHSQGGIMCMAHASKSHSLVAAFAICAIFPQMEEAIRLTLFSSLKKQRKRILKFIKFFASLIPILPVPLPFYLSVLKLTASHRKPLFMGKDKGRFSYPLVYLASLFDLSIDYKFNCPFWLYSARNDALFEKDLIIATFHQIIAPKKELFWLEDGGHLAPFNPWLAGFIARNIAAICAELGLSMNLENF